MNRVNAATLLLLTSAGFALAGCDGHEMDAGPRQTEAREVDDFDSIEMEGAARLEISVGSAESVTVEASEEVIKRVKTEIRGDTLYIESKPRDWFISDGHPRVVVKVTVPELESLEIQGGNDVRLDGFDGGESRIRTEGAAHIKARGRLDELTVHMAGAGHADLSRLIAEEAKVTVDGVGSVYVHPTDSLDATMNGVGAILYSGNPREVNTHMNGLGTIGRRDENDRRHEQPEEHIQSDPSVESDPDVEVDPDTLQPEYEDPDKRKTDSSTVI